MSEETISCFSFKLGSEQFAVNTKRIMEIIEVPKITKVPRAPEYLKGVINLRGSIIPVIDTRIKFLMDPIEFDTNTCIVVMEIDVDEEVIVIGALVDSVHEVLEIKKDDIKESPTIGSDYNPEFIQGVASINEDFIMILDIGKVFSIEEASEMNEAVNDEEKSQENEIKKSA